MKLEIKKMNKHIFTNPLSEFQADELQKKIWYLSEHLEQFDLLYEKDKCIGISYLIKQKYEKSFIEYVNIIIESDIKGLKDLKAEYVWKNSGNIKYHNIQNTLEKEKLVHIHGEGQISLRYPLTELFYFFDDLLKLISVNVLKGEEYRFPTLLKNSVLKKAGYYNSFPNLWMFASRLKNDLESFLSFRNLTKSNSPNMAEDLQSISKVTNYSLPPTMCYYVYDMFSNSILNNKTVTARGKSFRFENKYYKPFERLWDFTIRETVFLGDKDFVEKSLKKYREVIQNVFTSLEINCFCEYANDPFYLSEKNYLRVNVQKMNKSKVELRLFINREETIAVGSFNFHGQYLSKSFNLMKNEKEFIYTGCIGFGLERLLFAFLAQYGTDPSNWPDIISNYITERDVRCLFNKLVLPAVNITEDADE